MTIETLRGRYRLHRFPPRQRAVTGEPLTTSISARAVFQWSWLLRRLFRKEL